MDIKLYWASLKNEIDAETWKTGKCYITADKAEERAEAQTGNDTLDVNYCYRKIEQGIMQLQDIAHKFFTSFKRNPHDFNRQDSDDWADVEVGDTILYKDSKAEYQAVVVKKGTYLTEGTTVKSGDTTSEPSNVTFVKIVTDASYNNNETTNNKLSNNITYWQVTLNFGDRQNVNEHLLANELHKYIVLNVLQEWSKIANPTLTNEYVSRQNAEEVRVKSIMYRKEEPEWDE